MNPLPDRATARQQAAHEAVCRLGLLCSEAVSTVHILLEEAYEVHPKVICAAYRKNGEQISDSEKRALGIRKNAFMSREALADLSDAGMLDALRAHELTVLRASFVLFRYRSALSAERLTREHPDTAVEVQYDVFHPDACTVCNALHHKPVGPDWGLLPPAGCTCVTAPFGLHVHVDWIGGLPDEGRPNLGPCAPSLMAKFRGLFRLPQKFR